MKRITEWMVRRFLPNYKLVPSPIDKGVIEYLMVKHLKGYHLSKNPRRPKKGEGDVSRKGNGVQGVSDQAMAGSE